MRYILIFLLALTIPVSIYAQGFSHDTVGNNRQLIANRTIDKELTEFIIPDTGAASNLVSKEGAIAYHGGLFYYYATSLGGWVTPAAASGVSLAQLNDSLLDYLPKWLATILYQPLLGYTPESLSNKATSFGTINNTLYPSVQAVYNYLNANYLLLVDSGIIYESPYHSAITYQPIGNYALTNDSGSNGKFMAYWSFYQLWNTLGSNAFTSTSFMPIADSNIYGTGYVSLAYYYSHLPTVLGYSAGYSLLLSGTTFRVDSTVTWNKRQVDSFVLSLGYLTGNQTITLSGDITGSGTTSISTTLKSVGTAGTWGSSNTGISITTDAQGRVTAVSTYLELQGTVTSVGLTAPSVFSVSATPVTGAGTLGLVFSGGQTANQVLASPNGTTGAVSLRALVASDIPALSYLTAVIAGTNIIVTGGNTVTVDTTAGHIATKTDLIAYMTQTVVVTSYTTSVVPTSNVASPMATLYISDTAQAGALLFAAPSGSWADGQQLVFYLTDNGTARALTYNAMYHQGTSPNAPQLPTTTTISKSMILQFTYKKYKAPAHMDLTGYSDGYTP